MRFLASLFVAVLLTATQASEKPEAIEFSDLVDPLAVVFDDPYIDMGQHLLNELKRLVKLDQKLSQDNLDKAERAKLMEQRSAAKDMLEINGQNVDMLLSKRWEIAKKRKIARMATNPTLDKVEVALSGYLIPAPQATDGTYYGYLVPVVGMCSHLPPPPPNKLVRVKLLDDPKEQSLYVPVRVTGILRAEQSEATIYILDGETHMLSSWTLYANTFDRQKNLLTNGLVGTSDKTIVNSTHRP